MTNTISPLLIAGAMTLCGFYAGKAVKYIKLPSLIGFMITGVLLGPSLFDLLSEPVQHNFSFLTDVALGFVALSIGLELSFKSLKKQGSGIIAVIFTESIMAFVLVFSGVYFLTKDMPLALIFGAIAPASAPAGTVAIIQEFKAKGSLTRALYAVVGFDDGLGIIIFGFASAIARSMLIIEAGGQALPLWMQLMEPLKEVGLSGVVGALVAFLFVILARKLKSPRDIFILVFGFILLSAGLCTLFHLSLILTNMIMGIIIVNTQPRSLLEILNKELSEFMPLIFILFFVLAGANLHVGALPSLGLLGIVYVLCRTAGLMGGAALGSAIGKMEDKIRKYLGMGILSQAGVAIGLSLIVKKEFSELGVHGASIGSIVITTVTATCIFFELIGPVLTKIGLEKAGEITQDSSSSVSSSLLPKKK